MKKTVNDFLQQESTEDEKLPSTNNFKELNIQREEYIKKLYYDVIQKLNHENKVTTEENQMLREENIELKESKEIFDKIRSSRSWKLIGKYYEMRAKRKGS